MAINITWGSQTSGDIPCKIGIGFDSAVTNTTCKVNIFVYVWTKYSVSDSNNSLYVDVSTTESLSAATTKVGSAYVATTSNSSWSDANQAVVWSYNGEYPLKASTYNVSVAAKLSSVDKAGGTMTVTASFAIPTATTYKVYYDLAGGNGTYSPQTKVYGTPLQLYNVTPSRSGYTFLGWTDSHTSDTVVYSPGDYYTANATVTLYAVWSSNGYTVSYNANGGTGAPASQIKTHGVNLTLSSTIPKRTNYTFLGWGTSSTATTVSYSPGGTYTANSSITLYAIWESSYTKPRISNAKVTRCDSDGVEDPNGTWALASLTWATDVNISSIKYAFKEVSSTSWLTVTDTSHSGKSGTATKRFGGTLDSESAYEVKITVTDAKDSTSVTLTLPGKVYPIDVLSGGKGVSIGQAAYREGFDISMKTYMSGDTVFEKYARFTKYSLLENTVNTIGKFRLHEKWIGIYTDMGAADGAVTSSRIGWIGYGSTDSVNFTVYNNLSGSNITNKAWTVSSDKRLKQNVENIPEAFISIWKELLPKVFRWNELNGQNRDLHFGLIAQEVIATFEKYGLDYREYGLVNTITLPDDDTEYFGIAYDEYHMLTAMVLRETNKKLDSLQSQIDELKNAINELKNNK